MNSPFPSRQALSPFVAVGFAAIAVTGALLFFHVKNGAIMALHEWFGWAFIVTGTVHILLNWRPLLGYLRQRAGVLSLAVGIVATILLAAAGSHHVEGGHGGGRPGFQTQALH